MNRAKAKRVRRAHRGIGIAAMLFLLIIALTGMALNHADDMNLAAKTVPSFIAAWYYDGDRTTQGYSVDGRFVYLVGNDLYLDDTAVGVCAAGFEGAVALSEQIVALCGHELVVLSSGGELIERLGSVHGVPAAARLGVANGNLVLERDGEAVGFDLASLSTVPARGDVRWQQPAPVPAALTRDLLTGAISWEKVVMDVHSGRIIGLAGPWLADLVALALIVMSISGLVLWRLPPKDNGCRKPVAEE